MNLDLQVVVGLYHLASLNPLLTRIDVFMAQRSIFLIPLILAVVGIWPGRTLRERRQILLAAAISFVIAFVLGHIIAYADPRTRPFVVLSLKPLFPHDPTASFPSDHTILGCALSWPFVFRWPRRSWLLIVWVLLVGFARVAAGVHYPTDILGSAVIALVPAAAGYVLAAWLLVESRVIRSLVYFGL